MNLSEYNNVFCDSKEALEWSYRNGLPKDAVIKTSSPALLWLDNKNIKHVEARWTVHEMKKFQTTIQKFSEDVYDAAMLATNVSREEALCIVHTAVHFQKTLFKAACLKDDDFIEPRLFLKVDGYGGTNGNNMNAPWEMLLSNNSLLSTRTYILPDNQWTVLTTKGVSIWNRIKLGGVETASFRIITKIMKHLPDWLFRCKVLIPNENELVIEVAANLALRGVKISEISPDTIKDTQVIGRDRSDLMQSIEKIITNRTEQWVVPACVPICRAIFIDKVNKRLSMFDELVVKWGSVIINNSARFVLTNAPGGLNGQALSAACKLSKMPIVSAQHGVTIEISKLHGEVSFSFDNSLSDIVLVYNKKISEVENKSYFSKGKFLVVGMSLRHIRMKNYASKLTKSPPIVYISTNLYKGNLGLFVTWLTDYDRAKKEKKLIVEVLKKLPHRVRYKTYPDDNRRYADIDPILCDLKNTDNIELFDKKIDMRYLISECRIIVTSSATSTLSWPVMSGKPVVFINRKEKNPLTDDAHVSLSKGIFVFDDDKEDFHIRLREFLSKTIDEIEYLWQEKKIFREEMIKNYFSEYNGGAGRRAAKTILREYLN